MSQLNFSPLDKKTMVRIARSKKLPEWWRPREMGALFKWSKATTKVMLRRLLRRRVLEKKPIRNTLWKGPRPGKLLYRLDPVIRENLPYFIDDKRRGNERP